MRTINGASYAAEKMRTQPGGRVTMIGLPEPKDQFSAGTDSGRGIRRSAGY
jgi:hypothetical protein